MCLCMGTWKELLWWRMIEETRLEELRGTCRGKPTFTIVQHATDEFDNGCKRVSVSLAMQWLLISHLDACRDHISLHGTTRRQHGANGAFVFCSDMVLASSSM